MLRKLFNPKKNCVCPICKTRAKGFLPFGMSQQVEPRPDALCAHCKSLERHRLIWLYFKLRTNLFTDKVKMLHIAPEPLLADRLGKMTNIDYLSADLVSSTAMVKMDITDIHYPDSSFDVIYCSHVLEHIPDDRKAMQELRRVLHPDGWAVLQVPILLEKTYEDLNITTPLEREKLFGQSDHVRKYGLDYKDRLAEVGFIVTVDSFAKSLGAKKVKRYGLMENEDIYFCQK